MENILKYDFIGSCFLEKDKTNEETMTDQEKQIACQIFNDEA